MKIYLTDQLVDSADAKISVLDHGLLYGDGIFEGIRLYNNCLFKLPEHLQRLQFSAKALMLSLPWSPEHITDAIVQTCKANSLTSGYIRLIVTRGQGNLGLSPDSCSNPQLIIIADQIALYPEIHYQQGLKLITVPTRRISSAALSSHIKSLNYLNNILAKIEATQHGYQEAIMLNEQGYVAECTGDNLFILSKGKLLTPNSSDGALKGITREVVKEIAQDLNLPCETTQLTRYDLWNAEECFLTGTAAEIIPVTEVDGRQVGSGKPGPITKQCRQHFSAKTQKEGLLIS